MLHLSQHLPWTLRFSHKSSFCTWEREPTPLIMLFLVFYSAFYNTTDSCFFYWNWHAVLPRQPRLSPQLNTIIVCWYPFILEDSTLRVKGLSHMPQYLLNISLQIFMRSKALTFNYGPNKFKPWSKISLSLERAFIQTFLLLQSFSSANSRCTVTCF